MIGYLNKRLVHVNAWQSCAGAMRQVTRAILLHVRREFDSGYVFLIFGCIGYEEGEYFYIECGISICFRTCWLIHLTFEHDELLSQEHVFRYELRFASAKVCNGSKWQFTCMPAQMYK